jgi:Asp-tRNA(Asn)/Glu-tRNA(Gln) amidotransferase A subunit family amidase
MFASSLDGTLSTWGDQGPAGPNPGGYYPLSAIQFYQQARKTRAGDLPDMAKTVMLFAHVMRARYGNYYSAKAQNLLRPIRAQYDKALDNYDLLIMPTTVMKSQKIPPRWDDDHRATRRRRRRAARRTCIRNVTWAALISTKRPPAATHSVSHGK